jgi:neurotransmitter:Na+ symporter, NSS family
MSKQNSGEEREHWSGSLGFVLAAAGSAIGLGNIWKFPYIAGQNGGGAFVLIYLICIFAIGLPVMLCELSLGRNTQKNPVGAFKALQPKTSVTAHFIGFSMLMVGVALLFFQSYGFACLFSLLGVSIFIFGWVVAGFIGVLAGFVILSFYSVVGGWTIGYIVKAFSGELAFSNAETAGAAFKEFTLNPGYMIGFHIGFMLICAAIIVNGVRKGIERWSKILMPVLFVLLLILIMRGITLDTKNAGVNFFLTPDFSKLSGESILIALGHAFFTLSLGMGAMITYGSYISKKQNLFLSSLAIVALDTLIAIMGGLAIFPAVFAMNFEPDAGPGLVFVVLPVVFNSFPGGMGYLWAALFFLLLLIAAVTSGISLLEVVVAYMVDELKIKRVFSVIIAMTVITLMGVLCAVSIHNWDNLTWFHKILQGTFNLEQGSFFDVMDHLASNWMLPLGGLACSIFVGWIWGTGKAVEEIRHGSHNFADVHLIALLAGLKDDPSHNDQRYHVLTLAAVWGIFIRFITPVLVTIAFLHTLGWITF